jgi:N4-gp56 family major capsid protein
MANIGLVADYSTNILRRYFEPTLLKTAKDNLQLAKFAKREKLPTGANSDSTVRFFRRKATTLSAAGIVNDSTTGNAVVSSLVDGTPLTTRRDMADYDVVNATLLQIGSAARASDINTAQQMFKLVKDTVTLMGEECALHLDIKLADLLVDGALAGNKVYAGGATSTATLNALSASAGKVTMDEFLKAATNIKALRGSPIGGTFKAVTPVQCTLDIQKDADWIDAQNYASPENRIKGQLGKYGSVEFYETSNGYIEDLADAAEGTYDSSGTDGYVSFVLGADAFGTVELSGQGPYAPRIYIHDQGDKSDVLNQTIVVGWKAFWVGVVLNSSWYSVIRSKSTF